MSTMNWSELPSDVLHYLISFLPVPDYHRFGAVCRNWCTVAKEKYHRPAQQMPWLVLGEDVATKKHIFFNLSENKHYYLDIPELHKKLVRGSSFGWLFTVDIDLNIRMLNPITRKSYDLPTLDFRGEEEEVPIYIEWGVHKVILDHYPSERSDFTVVMVFSIGSHVNEVAFWRPGDLTWTLPRFDYGGGGVVDIIFCKGKFYVVLEGYFHSSRICVVDVGPDSKLILLQHQVPMFEEFYKHLVDFNGELLLIQWYSKEEHEEEEEEVLPKVIRAHVIVHKLDFEEGTYSECKHINNHAIFIGNNNSPVVIDPIKFSGCTQNAIYLSDFYRTGWYDLETYNMVTQILTRYYRFKNFSHFITPTWLPQPGYPLIHDP